MTLFMKRGEKMKFKVMIGGCVATVMTATMT